MLMEHLPPVGWADVATKTDLLLLKRDLELLEARFDLKLERMQREIEQRITARMTALFVLFATVQTVVQHFVN